MTLTSEQVEALAPDASAAKNGRGLSDPRKWEGFGRSENGLWGLCKGSGAKAYQVRVDFDGPAWKCSCPSFKLPCKHALGLLFLHAAKSGDFSNKEPPGFLTQWLEERRKRADQKAKKKSEVEVELTPELVAKREAAQAKRSATRDERMQAGIDELALFLEEIVSEGLASLGQKAFSVWDAACKRLIDAQLPGLARRVTRLGTHARGGSKFHEEALHELARLHLALAAWQRRGELSPAAYDDLREQLGIQVPHEGVLASPSQARTWAVLAQTVTQEDSIRVARTWLWSNDHEAALLLDFAAAGQGLKIVATIGDTIDAQLAFFPGTNPLRALVATSSSRQVGVQVQGLAAIDSMLEAYANLIAANPWTQEWPFLLDHVVVIHEHGSFSLQDAAGGANARRIILDARGLQGWNLLAISGGTATRIFGQWNGLRFEPLSVVDGDRVHDLCGAFS
jgi:hypothetical protein